MHYATIRFNGMNLKHGLKGKTMKSIGEALKAVLTLFPKVPLAETLDSWLDTAVASYLQRRGKRGNKSNTGEGDDPSTGQYGALYQDPELEMELSCYVQQGTEVAEELATSEVVRARDLETTRAMLDQAMGNVQLGNKNRKRPEPEQPDDAIDLENDSPALTEGAASAGATSMSCRARRQQHAMLQVGDVSMVLAKKVNNDAERVELEKGRLALDVAKLELERERLVEERKAAERMEKLVEGQATMLKYLMERL